MNERTRKRCELWLQHFEQQLAEGPVPGPSAPAVGTVHQPERQPRPVAAGGAAGARGLLASLLLAIFGGLGAALVLSLMTLLLSWPDQARADAMQGGVLQVIGQDGEPQQLGEAPLLHTAIEAQVAASIVRVRVVQEFLNPTNQWLEGRYLFPLPEMAAVDGLKLWVGQGYIEGEIRERVQAEQEYAAARAEGRKASLVSQERPNLFTTHLANIPPGEIVRVEIRYQQDLSFRDGEYSLRVPLAITPRAASTLDEVNLPEAAALTRDDPVELQIDLQPGFPLAGIESLYQQVAIEQSGDHYRVSLLPGEDVGRDFLLRWWPQPDGQTAVSLFEESWQGRHYSLLTLMPPIIAGDDQVPVRELLLVIDTSGSMQGESLQQARAALLWTLDRLRPQDRFNIIQFNSRSEALFDEPVRADSANLQQARSYVEGLAADGGTEMLPAIELAFAMPGSAETELSQLVFITDGAVGNEQALYQAIEQGLGTRRLFTVGIGAAPNSAFMTRAAEAGRGSFSFIGATEDVGERMQALFAKLASPVLTDLELYSDDSIEYWPNPLPDLYAGEPLTVAIRSEQPLAALTLSGQLDGSGWVTTLGTTGATAAQGVHRLWARRKIRQIMSDANLGIAAADIRAEVVETALEHQLVSQYTSLVAVDKVPVRPVSEALAATPQVARLRYPQTASGWPLWLLIGMLALLASGALRERQWA